MWWRPSEISGWPGATLGARSRVLAGELGRKPFQALLLVLEAGVSRPGAFQLVAHVHAQAPQALGFELDEIAVLQGAQPAVIRSGGEHVARLQRMYGRYPLDAPRDIVCHIARVEVLLEHAVHPQADLEVLRIRHFV